MQDGHHAGDVVCLDRELADDRVGERDGELGRGGPQDRHVGDEQRRAEPASREPQAVGDVGEAVGLGRCARLLSRRDGPVSP